MHFESGFKPIHFAKLINRAVCLVRWINYNFAIWQLDCAEATRALIAIIQGQLDNVSRNKAIYEKISAAMRAKGFDFDYKQCQTKIKNLSVKYRKVKNRVPCRLIRYISGTERLKTTIMKQGIVDNRLFILNWLMPSLVQGQHLGKWCLWRILQGLMLETNYLKVSIIISE